MDFAFKSVVERIFSNWTALKLAVDHNMGGPNSHQVATEIVNYMSQYCICNDRIEVEEIQEVLEDILDEEFDTVCEDDSPKEIASALFKFLQLLKDNNQVEFNSHFNHLPEVKPWLTMPHIPQQVQRYVEESSSDDEASTTAPDTEWTEVKSRRKR